MYQITVSEKKNKNETYQVTWRQKKKQPWGTSVNSGWAEVQTCEEAWQKIKSLRKEGFWKIWVRPFRPFLWALISQRNRKHQEKNNSKEKKENA